MHMADALISPAVGGTLWAAAAGTTAYCAKKVREEMDDRKVPLMGVLGAFIFSAQMLNFTIPAAGSSGHLGGGMILAILLGPYAAFIVMASVLAVQALFFADGGLLSLGCNIFNLGFFPAFVCYPLIYKKIVGERPTPGRIMTGAMLSAVVGLQLGALGVVLETVSSGVSEFPLDTFLLLMQPIHLAIGIVEGFATAAVVSFVWKEQPDILLRAAANQKLGGMSLRKTLVIFALAAVVCGGVISWFASSSPDGLEWSIGKIVGEKELEGKDSLLRELGGIQSKTAILPDYGFKKSDAEKEGEAKGAVPAWPAPDAGTSVSGLVGGLCVLLLAAGLGWLLNRGSRRRTKK